MRNFGGVPRRRDSPAASVASWAGQSRRSKLQVAAARKRQRSVHDVYNVVATNTSSTRLDEQEQRHTTELERARVEASEAARASGNRHAATELQGVSGARKAMRGARDTPSASSTDPTATDAAYADASRLDEQARRHTLALERARVEASEAARASGNRHAAMELQSLPSENASSARKAMWVARDTPSARSTDPTAMDAA